MQMVCLLGYCCDVLSFVPSIFFLPLICPSPFLSVLVVLLPLGFVGRLGQPTAITPADPSLGFRIPLLSFVVMVV